MNKIYNLDFLIEIVIKDKEYVYRWSYIPARKKGFWSKERKEAFSYFAFDETSTREEIIADGFLIENNKVYKKPYVKLYFAGERSFKKVFGTYRAAKSFGEQYTVTLKNKLETFDK